LTGIAGILATGEDTVTSKLAMILGTMQSRGSIFKSTIVRGNDEFVAIGICSHPHERPTTTRLEETSAVVDGQLPDSLEIEEIGGQADQQSLYEAMNTVGPFSCLTITAGRLLAIRDVLGQKPLYYGKGPDGTVAFASLRTALTNIGVQDPVPVPPGRLISISNGEPSILLDRSLTRSKEIKVSEREASTKLRALLVDSLSEDVPKDLALAFSGGLDSALVARASKENDLQPELITVGMKGQAELKHAREVSKQIDLDITVKELSQHEVLESLPDVVRTVESSDPTLVGVSVPLYFACESAQEMGADCFLAGQLSDELFAGYGRFDELAKNLRAAREEVWRSVLSASANDFDPGDKLAISHHLNLRCPFAYLPLVDYALRLPMSLKLRTVAGKVVRKYILRRVAADWNLPSNVVERPKKAVQYSTGVQKILLKEAKRRRLTLTGFLKTFS
jgi:asparagine synthase (glutamine-hydrolysing)